MRSFGPQSFEVVFKNAIWPPKQDVFYGCLKMAYVVKLDHSKKKTKLFCTFETNNSEKHDAQIEIWFN